MASVIDIDEGSSEKVEMFFFPYILGGHLVPMVAAARHFASHPDVKVTIVTTPKNAHLFQTAIDHDRKAGHDICFHTIDLPTAEVGLPDGVENLLESHSTELATKLFLAVMKLREPLLDLLRARRPDCLVSDIFHFWTVDVAKEVGIPRLEFHIHGSFALCAEDCLRRFKPHEKVGSDTEPFVLEGLPDRVEFTRLRIPTYYRQRDGMTQLLDVIHDAEEKSYGVIANSFYDLESEYADYFRNVAGKRLWAIGPVTLYSSRDNGDKGDQGSKNAKDEENILKWLESKEPNSVVYVSFGSQPHMSKDQCHELAHGLEGSGHPFIWVARTNLFGKQGNDDHGQWFPEGFEDRMRDSNQGLIIKRWAPQLLILGHRNVGVFMTHCGWNSSTEGLNYGLPMITWPMISEQFFNESLLVDVLKVGIRVGNEECVSQHVEPKVTVKRDKVEAAVRRMMAGGQEVAEMRKKAEELGEKSRKAVQEGGSSHRDLCALVEELKARQTSPN